MPGGEAVYEPGEPREEGSTVFSGASLDELWRVKKTIWSGGLNVGDRLRASISWCSCALGGVGWAPAQLAVDFDLFLFNADTQEYIFGSQSFDDSNEGFDVVIQTEDGAGWYEVYAAWPDPVHATWLSPCGDEATEPLAWATSVWR